MMARAKPVEEISEVMEEDAPAPVEYVEYANAQHFEVRTITVRNWEDLNVEDGKLVHWYSGNNFRVPREEFDFLTEQQFSLYILADPRLQLVTE
jgi:hypothetical protein